MLTSCKTLVCYHNHDIDIATIHRSYSGISVLSCFELLNVRCLRYSWENTSRARGIHRSDTQKKGQGKDTDTETVIIHWLNASRNVIMTAEVPSRIPGQVCYSAEWEYWLCAPWAPSCLLSPQGTLVHLVEAKSTGSGAHSLVPVPVPITCQLWDLWQDIQPLGASVPCLKIIADKCTQPIKLFWELSEIQHA